LLFAFRKSIRKKVKDSVIQSMLDTKPETHESQQP
jgi:hypothetical protein